MSWQKQTEDAAGMRFPAQCQVSCAGTKFSSSSMDCGSQQYRKAKLSDPDSITNMVALYWMKNNVLACFLMTYLFGYERDPSHIPQPVPDCRRL